MYIEPDYTYRDESLARIRADLESGLIDRLSFQIARKQYGVTSDNDIRAIQHQLRKEGVLIRKGNRFVSSSMAA